MNAPVLQPIPLDVLADRVFGGIPNPAYRSLPLEIKREMITFAAATATWIARFKPELAQRQELRVGYFGPIQDEEMGSGITTLFLLGALIGNPRLQISVVAPSVGGKSRRWGQLNCAVEECAYKQWMSRPYDLILVGQASMLADGQFELLRIPGKEGVPVLIEAGEGEQIVHKLLADARGWTTYEVTERPFLEVFGDVGPHEVLATHVFGFERGRADEEDHERRYRMEWIARTLVDLLEEDTEAGRTPEDIAGVGMYVKAGNSLNDDDLFVTLPRRFAVRLRERKVYRMSEQGLADPVDALIEPELVDEVPGKEEEWAERASWACKVWWLHVRDYVKTLMFARGTFVDHDAPGEIRTFLKSMDGVSEQARDVIAQVIAGVPERVPSKAELEVFHAIQQRDEGMVRSILDKPGIAESACDHEHTPVLFPLLEWGNPALIELALARGAHPRSLNGNLVPALCWASGHGQAASVRVLLNHGVDANEHDPLGRSALFYAMIKSRWENAEVLVDAGGNARQEAKTGIAPIDIAEGTALTKMIDGMGGDMPRDLQTTLRGLVPRADGVPKSLLKKLKVRGQKG